MRATTNNLATQPGLGNEASDIDVYKVWEFFSYAWTEIGIEGSECDSLAREARVTANNLNQVDRIFFRDVCASFAVDSFLIFPLMLWVIMPEWGYAENYLRNRVRRWYEKPYWMHFVNPFRILGYPIAVLFAFSYRSKIRRSAVANADRPAP
ncbi:MAG: hypothetical protein V4625_12220 [Pseudomonadota bacterium]